MAVADVDVEPHQPKANGELPCAACYWLPHCALYRVPGKFGNRCYAAFYGHRVLWPRPMGLGRRLRGGSVC
jgi:hypothetical protein